LGLRSSPEGGGEREHKARDAQSGTSCILASPRLGSARRDCGWIEFPIFRPDRDPPCSRARTSWQIPESLCAKILFFWKMLKLFPERYSGTSFFSWPRSDYRASTVGHSNQYHCLPQSTFRAWGASAAEDIVPDESKSVSEQRRSGTEDL